MEKLSRVDSASETGTENVRIMLCVAQIAPSDAGFENTYWFENTLSIFRSNNDAVSPAISLGQPSPTARMQCAVWI